MVRSNIKGVNCSHSKVTRKNQNRSIRNLPCHFVFQFCFATADLQTVDLTADSSASEVEKWLKSKGFTERFVAVPYLSKVFELEAIVKQIQVVVRAGLEPGTAGLRVRLADHWATLPPARHEWVGVVAKWFMALGLRAH